MSNAKFLAIVVMLLSAMAWMMVSSVRQESQTWDEGIHLAAGYSYWKTGDYRMNPEHPPLGKLLNAIPLLWLNPPLPLNHSSWRTADEFLFGRQFLYYGPDSPRQMLFRARMVTVALTLLLGLCLALWTRTYFSDWVAIAVLAFFCFDPTVIAHGRYVTTDLVMALTSFLAVAAWLSWLERGGHWRLPAAGFALGLAMASKYSWPFLLVVFPLIALAIRAPWKRAVFGLPAAIVVGGMVVAATYAPVAVKLLPATRSYRTAHPEAILLSKAIEGTFEAETPLGQAASWASRRFGIQDHPYLAGILKHAVHARFGHPSYLLGQVSDYGWWYYFPVALAVKEPVGLLLGVMLCLCTGLTMWRRSHALQLAGMVVAIYLTFAILASINIGIRHLLPLLPFLYVVIAATLFERWPRILLACVLLMAAETTWWHPHYLPFFNLFAGGAQNGPRYLADSNLDWGQDFERLRDWRDANLGSDHLCLSYFGGASVEYYGMAGSPVPSTDDAEGREEVDCIAVVSATLLVGAYDKPRTFQWLRERKPWGKVGYTYYLYDLRKKR